MKALLIWMYLIPRNGAILALHGYRLIISPLYGDVCRYYPSCSSYGLQAIQQRGLVVGSGLAVYRIMRCHPWASGGVDDVPFLRNLRFRITRFGFVASNSQRKA